MSDPNDWNSKVIEEFRANGGKVGGQFEGAPMVLIHHNGRRSGREYVNPTMYLPGDDRRIYVFASKGGAPTNPQWYSSLVAEPVVELQDGTVTRTYKAHEVFGDEKAVWWRRAVEAFPDYAVYQRKTDRQIPVLVLEPSGGDTPDGDATA